MRRAFENLCSASILVGLCGAQRGQAGPACADDTCLSLLQSAFRHEPPDLPYEDTAAADAVASFNAHEVSKQRLSASAVAAIGLLADRVNDTAAGVVIAAQRGKELQDGLSEDLEEMLSTMRRTLALAQERGIGSQIVPGEFTWYQYFVTPRMNKAQQSWRDLKESLHLFFDVFNSSDDSLSSLCSAITQAPPSEAPLETAVSGDSCGHLHADLQGAAARADSLEYLLFTAWDTLHQIDLQSLIDRATLESMRLFQERLSDVLAEAPLFSKHFGAVIRVVSARAQKLPVAPEVAEKLERLQVLAALNMDGTLTHLVDAVLRVTREIDGPLERRIRDIEEAHK